MKCKFHVGQKVVCVENHMSLDEYAEYVVGTPVFPIIGEVYLVAEILLFPSSGAACLDLVELPPITLHNGVAPAEFYWDALKFRPVHDTTATVEAIKRKAIDDAAKAPGNVKPVRVNS